MSNRVLFLLPFLAACAELPSGASPVGDTADFERGSSERIIRFRVDASRSADALAANGVACIGEGVSIDIVRSLDPRDADQRYLVGERGPELREPCPEGTHQQTVAEPHRALYSLTGDLWADPQLEWTNPAGPVDNDPEWSWAMSTAHLGPVGTRLPGGFTSACPPLDTDRWLNNVFGLKLDVDEVGKAVPYNWGTAEQPVLVQHTVEKEQRDGSTVIVIGGFRDGIVSAYDPGQETCIGRVEITVGELL